MKRLVILISLFLFCWSALPVMAEDESEHVIKYRQYLMSSISSHFKSLKYLSSGKISRPEQMLPHSRALYDLAKMVETSFPEDSDFGETDAKETIWSNKDDFNQKAKALVKASEALLKPLESNDTSMALKQMDDIGQSCKSCHKKYREK